MDATEKANRENASILKREDAEWENAMKEFEDWDDGYGLDGLRPEIDAIEKRLDGLFEEKRIIPVNERSILWGRILALPNHDGIVTILKKFAFLNVFPVDYDSDLWTTF